MTDFRLFSRCHLLALSFWACATSVGAAQVGDNTANSKINSKAGSKPAGQIDLAIAHKPEKLAGRANNASDTNAATGKNSNDRSASYLHEVHEKKPLSKEEKRALRRQVSETEGTYPQRK